MLSSKFTAKPVHFMQTLDNPRISEKGFVSTIHVLSSGEIIYSVQDFLKIESRFSWVDKRLLVSKILELQKKTDDRKSSYIVLYEEGNLMREFLNVDQNFRPLPYC